jgi:hypothetical protein
MTDLMCKDVGLAVDAARNLRIPLFVAPAAQQVYRLASSHGLARKDFTSIYSFLKPSAGTSPSRAHGLASSLARPSRQARPRPRGGRGRPHHELLCLAPEIVRQVVVRQVPKTIGRQISIEDIDLNLFTGYMAVKKLRLTERDGRQTFVEFERLEARLALWGLVGRNIRVREFRLVAPAVRIVRGQNGELNFQDLMPGVQKADVAREPTKWAFTLDHGAIERGRLIVEDRAVSPAADWSIQDFAVETSGVSTRPNSPPGRLKASLRMGTAALDFRWDKFQQAPVRVEGVIKLTGLDLTRARPYLPPPLADAFASGTFRTDLKVAYTRTTEGLQSAQASGEAAVESVGLVKAGTKDSMLATARLGVGIKGFDLEGREVTLSSVELTGFDAQIRRDKSGQIDLLVPFSKPAGRLRRPRPKLPPRPSRQHLRRPSPRRSPGRCVSSGSRSMAPRLPSPTRACRPRPDSRRCSGPSWRSSTRRRRKACPPCWRAAR